MIEGGGEGESPRTFNISQNKILIFRMRSSSSSSYLYIYSFLIMIMITLWYYGPLVGIQANGMQGRLDDVEQTATNKNVS